MRASSIHRFVPRSLPFAGQDAANRRYAGAGQERPGFNTVWG